MCIRDSTGRVDVKPVPPAALDHLCVAGHYLHPGLAGRRRGAEHDPAQRLRRQALLYDERQAQIHRPVSYTHLGAGGVQHAAGGEEQQALEQCMVDGVVQSARYAQRSAQTQAGEDIAYLAY